MSRAPSSPRRIHQNPRPSLYVYSVLVRPAPVAQSHGVFVLCTCPVSRLKALSTNERTMSGVNNHRPVPHKSFSIGLMRSCGRRRQRHGLCDSVKPCGPTSLSIFATKTFNGRLPSAVHADVAPHAVDAVARSPIQEETLVGHRQSRQQS
jgi:hypothetical protein